MPEVIVGRVDDPPTWTAAAQAFRAWNPGYTLGQGTVGSAAEALLTPTPGAVRYCWLFDGRGEVWLPAGYRTQEGDGARLPPAYGPDPLDPEAHDALATLRAALTAADGAIPEGVRAPLTAIMERWQQPAAFVGNVDGEVWRLLESGIAPERWLDGAPGAALRWLAARTETLGWSTKRQGSWEPVGVGDQVIVRAEAPLRIRGPLRYWWIEDHAPAARSEAAVRRLRYLKDTAGGCAPGFDAFRRLPLTWSADLGGAGPAGTDGPNRVNCHALHIGAELSRTHYHPPEPIGGGQPQFELYFALDPAQWRLGTAGRVARLYTFPAIGDWPRYEVTDLTPGTIALIPAGTGHRGCDVFAHIVTLPGFKPGNELYLGRAIRDATAGASPHNPELAAAESASAPLPSSQR